MFCAHLLLNPISAAQPSGADLSYSSELDAINEARRFDDPSLDQGEWVTDLKEADWDFVASSCAALLADKSKDLRLAVWLTEAGARQHHLCGLAEGFRLLAGLCEQFWDNGLHPLADDRDHEQRIGNLSWILGRAPALLREMTLTEGRDTAYSAIDFEMARKQGDGVCSGARTLVKLAEMETARRNNSPQFCARFNADAQSCLEALLQLEQAADARLGADSPGFSTLKDALQTMQGAMPETAPDIVESAAPPDADPASAPAAQHPTPSGTVQSRAQALAQLRLIAQFFRCTEPHSPVSYFADKAADAGEQSLHTWLRSVVKDQDSLAHIEELLGVQPPASGQ
jgi:type VI secretion system protein ImpA